MAKNHSQLSRRTILKSAGVLAVAGVSATGLGSSQQSALEIEQYPEAEYVVISNDELEGDVDLTGFSINFEAEDDDYNQIREPAGEVVIPAGESITVPTGAREAEGDNIVELADPYDGEVLNNDGSDVVTLLDTDEQVVASTADNVTYTLNLTVIGPDEEPVAGADVGIVGYDSGAPVSSGTTDENGQATFDLRNGSYAAEVASEAYAQPSDDRGVRINGSDVERTIQLVTSGGSEEDTDTDTDTDTDGSEGNDSGNDGGSSGDGESDDSDGSTDGSSDSEESESTDEKDCPSR